MAGEINWGLLDPSMPGKVANSFYQGQQEQRQNALQELAFKKAQQDMADDDAYREVTRLSGGDTNRMKEMLFGKGMYDKAAAIERAQLEAEAKRTTIAKDKAATIKSGQEVVKIKLEQHREQLGGINDPQTAAQWVASSWNDPDLGAILKRGGGTLEQSLANIPQDPQQFKQWKLQNGLGLEKVIELTTPKPTEVRLGDRVVVKDMNPNSQTYGQVISEDKIAVSPDANLQAGVTVRGQNLTDARGREANDLKRAEIAQGGKPPPGYRWKNDGSLEAIPGGPGDKLPEAQQKQVVGVNNLSNAITEYLNELQNFGKMDAIRPDSRATMGTKYNNMMLQAKEAYNLGVLNGPDFQILQSVVTDPRSMRGVITSKEALSKQATELDRIMRQIATVSSKPRQEVPTTSPSAPAGAPKRISSDADYNALPSGTEFVGPDGKTRRKP